jgi:UDP-N-acetyl-D-galactosamine dehydrogenase
MGGYVAKSVAQQLAKLGKTINGARVLVMGVTFKENVSDIRNTKVIDVLRELQAFGMQVDAVDPMASAADFAHEYGFALAEAPSGPYDAVVLAVSHRQYLGWTEAQWQAHAQRPALFADLKGVYRKAAFQELAYWSL